MFFFRLVQKATKRETTVLGGPHFDTYLYTYIALFPQKDMRKSSCASVSNLGCLLGPRIKLGEKQILE